MKSPATKVVLVGLVVGLGCVSGCGGRKALGVGAAGHGGGGIGGMAGSTDGSTAGAAGPSTAGASGAGEGGAGGLAGSNVGGAGGAAGQASGGASGLGGGGPAGGTDGGGAGTIGAGLGFGGSDLTTIVKTLGCGKDPGQELGTLVQHAIVTTGIKAQDCAAAKCGAWTYVREYYLQLPTGYDKTRAYPLVVEGPGCGGKGNNLYALDDLASSVIRVGLSPSVDAQPYAATRPNQGCFDFDDGDNSIDWVFYETLYDELAGQLCFDKNRVFVIGSASGGGQMADELGCKYAGDPVHPVRGMLANTGGLSTDPKYAVTCSSKPMAGMWIHEVGDTLSPFADNKVAIARAMKVNGCTLGTGYDDATFENFPLAIDKAATGLDPAATCRKIKGCPDLTPLVVCALHGNQHTYHADLANPGFAKFIELFSAAPLLTP